MRAPHVRALTIGLAIALSVSACSDDSTAPSAARIGPTAPQGPRATPPNAAPSANAGADVLAECASHAGATVALNGSGADSDGRVILFEWFEAGELVATGGTPTLTLSFGTHTLLLQVTDNAGGTNDDVVVVTIEDTKAPSIEMSIGPTALWPPNHEMRLVATGVAVSDVCDPAPTLDVIATSNEPVNGLGDGDTSPDWLTQRTTNGTFDVSVRAERSGLGSGRIYSIGASATDHAGNAVARSGTVTVAHNQ